MTTFKEKVIPTPININYPDSKDLNLKIAVGACHVNLRPGEEDTWVTGSYYDPYAVVPCRISQHDGTVKIAQKFDVTSYLEVFSGVPTFDLVIGKNRPFTLTFEGGASENKMELGGLPITRLDVKLGAARCEINFEMPNPQQMSYLFLGIGAGGIELKNLANANFRDMNIEGGVAGYKFDFGGRLQSDAHVRIATALSTVEIAVPNSTAARIVSSETLGSLNVREGFTSRESGAFWTKAAVDNQSPILLIEASVALGSLDLKTMP